MVTGEGLGGGQALVKDVLQQLKGGLIVSCQARQGEPLFGPVHMTAMAKSAVLGGAVGIRANGVDDVAAIRRAVKVPVIGLCKVPDQAVYITPTVSHAIALCQAGAEIIAVQACVGDRQGADSLPELVDAIHHRGSLVLGDISDPADALFAVAAGVDAVATTLAGYRGLRPKTEGPDLELVRVLAEQLSVPLIAEGRFRYPAEVQEALALGAWAVVVGGAITRPSDIASAFVSAL